jgi:hypothetical protein
VGVEEKNKNSGVTTNTLTLVGDVSFSGVENNLYLNFAKRICNKECKKAYTH